MKTVVDVKLTFNILKFYINFKIFYPLGLKESKTKVEKVVATWYSKINICAHNKSKAAIKPSTNIQKSAQNH